MNGRDLLIFGGTRDAYLLCQSLDMHGINYWLSVATSAGRQQVSGLKGAILEGRMDAQEIINFCHHHKIQQLADISHPYAAMLSENILQVQREVKIPLLRYNRPSEIDEVNNPLVYKADSIARACELALTLGQRILLTTGSKQLADYIARLPEKTVLARVLPTHDVLAQCESYGMTIDQIFALKGPFSAEFNEAFYRYCRADVVMTKESGTQGGFSEKVAPCIALGIPCIVIVRPKIQVSDDVAEFQDLDEIEQFLLSRFSAL